MNFIDAVGGRYVTFVWGAYAASAVAFAWMLVDTLVRAQAVRRRLERLERDAGEDRK